MSFGDQCKGPFDDQDVEFIYIDTLQFVKFLDEKDENEDERE